MSISNQIPIYDNYDLSLHIWQFACTYDLFGDSGVKKRSSWHHFLPMTQNSETNFFGKCQKGISLAQPDSISSTKEVKNKNKKRPWNLWPTSDRRGGIGGGGGGKIIPYVDQFQTKISATRNSTLRALKRPSAKPNASAKVVHDHTLGKDELVVGRGGISERAARPDPSPAPCRQKKFTPRSCSRRDAEQVVESAANVSLEIEAHLLKKHNGKEVNSQLRHFWNQGLKSIKFPRLEGAHTKWVVWSKRVRKKIKRNKRAHQSIVRWVCASLERCPRPRQLALDRSSDCSRLDHLGCRARARPILGPRNRTSELFAAPYFPESIVPVHLWAFPCCALSESDLHSNKSFKLYLLIAEI